jgi:hypothetical protein
MGRFLSALFGWWDLLFCCDMGLADVVLAPHGVCVLRICNEGVRDDERIHHSG